MLLITSQCGGRCRGNSCRTWHSGPWLLGQRVLIAANHILNSHIPHICILYEVDPTLLVHASCYPSLPAPSLYKTYLTPMAFMVPIIHMLHDDVVMQKSCHALVLVFGCDCLSYIFLRYVNLCLLSLAFLAFLTLGDPLIKYFSWIYYSSAFRSIT